MPEIDIPGLGPMQREPREKVLRPHRGPRSSPHPHGPPPYAPTDAQRKIVTLFRGAGVPPQDIARHLHVSLNTLKKYFRPELDQGHAEVVARIGAKAVQKALAGDNTMIMFYLRSHGGDAWRDRQRLEHTGADGTPLLPPNLVISFLEP